MRVVSWNCQQRGIDSPLWEVLTDFDAVSGRIGNLDRDVQVLMNREINRDD